MKIRAIVYVLVMFSLLANLAFAAMNGPTGLAVDSKGNLYVAHFNSNQILVYGPTHKLIKSKTITDSINGPSAIALDPQGNLWVANFSSSQVLEFSAGIPTMMMTSGISNPTSIAVDSLGDVWLVNGGSSLVVIDRNTNPILSLSANQVEPGASFLYSVGISSQGFCAFGSNAVYSESYVADVLTGNGTNKVAGVLGDGGEAVALDDYTLYSANSYGVVTKDLNIPVLNLNYIPGGMAVDSAQGLLYFSNNASNVIDVYSTSGTYVTTIH